MNTIINQINKTQNELDKINDHITICYNSIKLNKKRNNKTIIKDHFLSQIKEADKKRVNLVKTREDLYLKLRVKNINILHSFINEITPQIMNFCSQYIELKHIKKDNSLNKKLVDRINNYINDLKNNDSYKRYNIQSYFKDSHNTKYLVFRISWYDGRSNNYYDTEKMVFHVNHDRFGDGSKSLEFYNSNDYQNMPINTFGYVKKVMKQLKKHDEKIESLLKTRNQLQSNINNFQNVYNYKHVREVR